MKKRNFHYDHNKFNFLRRNGLTRIPRVAPVLTETGLPFARVSKKIKKKKKKKKNECKRSGREKRLFFLFFYFLTIFFPPTCEFRPHGKTEMGTKTYQREDDVTR